MLGSLFAGHATVPSMPDTMTETAFTMTELDKAIQKLKAGRMADEGGLVAELLKHSPHEVRAALLQLYNQVLTGGLPPQSWRRTLFIMLAKSAKSKLPSEFRPIASSRLLYKTYAYMILGRIEDKLDQAQPEEQHGFRGGYRIEEHLLTAATVIDRTLAMNIPIWIISLDLSKAFDRIAWPALWEALKSHGISDHLVWLLQTLYHDQKGEVRGDWAVSDLFDILAGVRQGCVLSARLFCCALQWAMQKWRQQVESAGIDMKDGVAHLLDLRFADDILLFSGNAHEVGHVLDVLIHELAQVGLILNPDKTVALTTEAQPPANLTTAGGTTIRVIERASAQKWLGCMLTTARGGACDLDVEHHLQAANKAFQANKWLLTDKATSLSNRLRYFDKVVSPVACFGACHRTIYQEDLRTMDVQFRKLLRRIVPPPGDLDWTQPFHEILHLWHEKISDIRSHVGVRTWAETSLRQYWKFAQYIAHLPDDRWLVRVLAWIPDGAPSRGRPTNTWDSMLRAFCVTNSLGDWKEAAQDKIAWLSLLDDFLLFAGF